MPRRAESAVGKRVARARRGAALTQSELASAVGLDRTAVSKIESGRRRVGVHELGRLAAVLDRPPAWFLAEDANARLDLRWLRHLRPRILEVASDHGASNVRVFGSLARGESDEGSDVDFLVDMLPNHSLIDRAALVVDLEKLLGCTVDVATPQALRDRIRDRVLREAVTL
jgi:hypothetical protein